MSDFSATSGEAAELEQTRQALAANKTLLRQFAHEFNNILGIIIGYSDLAKMNLADNPRVSRHLEEVLKAGLRAKEIVQQILASSAPPATTLPATSDSVSADTGQRILLVDDEPALAEAASLSLEHYGFRVTGVHSAAEALAAFHRQPGGFDLVITDLNMPGMSGIELANALYEARPELPVILVSGFGSARTSHFDHGPGIRAVLSKPFTTEVLASTVHQLLSVESKK